MEKILIFCFIGIKFAMEGIFSTFFEKLVANHPLKPCNVQRAKIIGFGECFELSKNLGVGKYFSIVEYLVDGKIYTNNVARCENDFLQREIIIAIGKSNKEFIARYNYEKSYGKNFSGVILCFFCGIILCSLCVLVPQKQLIVWGVVLLLSFILDYLMLPIYHNFRQAKWKQSNIKIRGKLTETDFKLFLVGCIVIILWLWFEINK